MTGPERVPRLTRYDAGWRAGFDAGKAERFWHGIRRLWIPTLVIGWVYLAVSRRTPDLVRVLAAFGVLAALWVAVVFSPVELAWLIVRAVRRHRRRAAEVAPFPL